MCDLERKWVGVEDCGGGCLLPTAQRIGCTSRSQLGKLWAILLASTFKAANPRAEAFLDQSALYKCITWSLVTSQKPRTQLV